MDLRGKEYLFNPISIYTKLYLLIGLINSGSHNECYLSFFQKSEIMLQKVALSLATLFFAFALQSQDIIYSYTFDADEEAWVSDSLSNTGLWSWTPTGKADQGNYWNDRPSIDESSNGALVYDGDYIISSGIGNPSESYSTAIESPIMDFTGQPDVFIKFNQYYRNYESNTSLQISINLGATWNTIDLNEGVNRNVETNPKDYEIINISDIVGNEETVNIRFVFDGGYYFWILDDIFLYDSYPVIPTFPAYVGEYLTLHGYPYEVDDKGWPYIPNEAIVSFVPGTSDAIKAQIREEAGAVIKEVCVCDALETWTLVDSLLEGAIGLSATGETTGANEPISTSTSASEIDDIDFNKYVKAELTDGIFIPPSIDDILEAHQPPKGKTPLKIAVIDTGVDILHDGLDDFLHRSQETPYDAIDDDANCYPDNYVGWNFVDDNNNASDDHGHGSHVAGIVAKYAQSSKKKQKVQIIPYKTHDSKGLANLFDVTCAMYQSIQDEVSVVNCSWGFYGNESQVLKTAIREAGDRNITVVAATGNDSIYLVESQQYPACYKLPNLISVGSYNIEKREGFVINSYFSNYSAKFVDVLASGVHILSTVPYNNYDYKTGTSMAAPAIAGLAAKKYLTGNQDPVSIKSSILFDAQDYDHLTFEVLNGNVLLHDPILYPDIINLNISGLTKNSSNQISSKREVQMMNVSIEKLDQQIKIEFLDKYHKVNAYITNAQGQIFMSRTLKNIHEGAIEIIELNVVPSGLYFLKVNEKVYEFVVF